MKELQKIYNLSTALIQLSDAISHDKLKVPLDQHIELRAFKAIEEMQSVLKIILSNEEK